MKRDSHLDAMPEVDESYLKGVQVDGARRLGRLVVQSLGHHGSVLAVGSLVAGQGYPHVFGPTAYILVVASGEHAIDVEEVPADAPEGFLLDEGAAAGEDVPVDAQAQHQPRGDAEALPDFGKGALENVVGDV